ncbi:MAG: HlyD family efflux transporter periplasmic adaptor subunit [Fuerstiella sp.]
MTSQSILRSFLSLGFLLSFTNAPVAVGDNIRISQATVQLINECSIPARDSGQLILVSALQGKAVTKGQVVAVLENQQQELALSHAKLKNNIATLLSESDLNLLSATAKVEEVEAALRVRKIALQVAEKEANSNVAVSIAEAESKLRQLERQRAEKARQTFERSVSESQMDRLKTDQQRWQLEVSKATTEQAVRKLKPAAEQAAIQQAQKEIARSKVALQVEQQNQAVAVLNQQLEGNAVQAAMWNLELRNVRSPIDGIVASVDLQQGEWVEAGTVVVRIIDLKRLRVEGLLQAKLASQNLVGQAAEVRIGDQRIPASVVYVGREIDPIDQLVSIYAEFDNPNGDVLPGAIAELIVSDKN